MKIAIAKWVAKYLLDFIMNNIDSDKSLVVTYYYKGTDVHKIETDMNEDHYIWFKDMQLIKPIDPPENWDKWVVTIK